MKILVLTIVVFTLNAYVTTSATSLDPAEYVEMEDGKSESDEARTKRSGDIFQSLLKKKFGLLSSLSSSGKSIGSAEHYEEPLSYHTKSFNLWGVKKAIMGSVLQAAKAITGGVIALKGQLIKAKGHVVVAKGKLLQTKGEAISNFGKTIATHAFDSHLQEPQIDVIHTVGLYNHLPVTPIHQPTSYGAATALGYQAQAYPGHGFTGHAYQGNGFPANGYPVAAASYPTGFAVPSSAGYDVQGTGYGGYGGGGGNGFTAKRAVQQNQQDSLNQVNNQMKNMAADKDVQAGLVIFKPIKMGSNGGTTSQQQNNNNNNGQRPSQLNGNRFTSPLDFKGSSLGGSGGGGNGFRNPFPGYPTAAANGFQSAQSGGYSVFGSPQGYSQQSTGNGYSAQGPHLFPTVPSGGGGGGSGSDSFESSFQNQGLGFQNFGGFAQPALANQQEFNRQLQAALSAQQQQQAAYSQEINNQNLQHFGGDQNDSGSDSDEHLAQPSYKNTRHVELPKSSKATANYFLPTTARYPEDEDRVAADRGASRGNKRSTTTDKDTAVTASQGKIVPLKYENDSSPEDQERLKKTVQRFFSLLQKHPWLLSSHSSSGKSIGSAEHYEEPLERIYTVKRFWAYKNNPLSRNSR